MGQHLRERARAADQNTLLIASKAREVVKCYCAKVAENPREEAPVLAAGVLWFAAGSGGIDGDGGLPDMDLMGGIGAHRSLLTHTIVIGVLTETTVLGLVDLVGR